MKVTELEEIQQRSLEVIREICSKHHLTVSEMFEVVEALRNSIIDDLEQLDLASVNQYFGH